MHPALGTILKRPGPQVYLNDLREDVSNATTYTFTACAVSIGPAMIESSEEMTLGAAVGSYPRSPSRATNYCIVHAEDSATVFNVSSVTLGGVAGSEVTDRGGATNAINTAFYGWDSANLSAIANTDVVVTMSEAITGCAIAMIRVENIGVAQTAGINFTATGTGALDLVGTQSSNVINAPQGFFIFATTNATGGGTEHMQWNILGSHAGYQMQMLYEGSNAEFDYGAFFVIIPQYCGLSTTDTVAEFQLGWSGTGAGDSIMVVEQ